MVFMNKILDGNLLIYLKIKKNEYKKYIKHTYWIFVADNRV